VGDAVWRWIGSREGGLRGLCGGLGEVENIFWGVWEVKREVLRREAFLQFLMVGVRFGLALVLGNGFWRLFLVWGFERGSLFLEWIHGLGSFG
jgi:hypothetical protein